MNVLLATSWGQPFCGIQAHSEMLIAAVKQADPEIQITPDPDALDPSWVIIPAWRGTAPVHPDILCLNYHRALCSRWRAPDIRSMKGAGSKIVIVFHDTWGENPPDALSEELCDLADAFIVHEPCLGLEKAIYWRMGVPVNDGREGMRHREYKNRPILGTLGFGFGWKSWGAIADAADLMGWGLLIVTPKMSAEERRQFPPHVDVHEGLNNEDALASLSECDATAFMNVCGNSGQSAAILQGIGARKPLIALKTCRQYRALFQDPIGAYAIRWVENFNELSTVLSNLPLVRFDTQICTLAEQDSWEQLGRKYANLYHELLT